MHLLEVYHYFKIGSFRNGHFQRDRTRVSVTFWGQKDAFETSVLRRECHLAHLWVSVCGKQDTFFGAPYMGQWNGGCGRSSGLDPLLEDPCVTQGTLCSSPSRRILVCEVWRWCPPAGVTWRLGGGVYCVSLAPEEFPDPNPLETRPELPTPLVTQQLEWSPFLFQGPNIQVQPATAGDDLEERIVSPRGVLLLPQRHSTASA